MNANDLKALPHIATRHGEGEWTCSGWRLMRVSGGIAHCVRSFASGGRAFMDFAAQNCRIIGEGELKELPDK